MEQVTVGGTDEMDRTARFYRVVWPQAALVLRYARVLTHRQADAEDLSQEAMLKAFKALDSLHDEGGVKSWLLTILRNCHIDRSRSRGRKLEVSYDAMEVELAAPGHIEHVPANDPEGLLNEFSDEEMVEALRKLPEEIRWTLLLVDVEGMADADAAGVIGVPVGTVKSRLHRGRRMLYRSLLPVAKNLRMTV
jgi:RNA polymerase sigma-70 factor, ECF subfamily